MLTSKPIIWQMFTNVHLATCQNMTFTHVWGLIKTYYSPPATDTTAEPIRNSKPF